MTKLDKGLQVAGLSVLHDSRYNGQKGVSLTFIWYTGKLIAYSLGNFIFLTRREGELAGVLFSLADSGKKHYTPPRHSAGCLEKYFPKIAEGETKK